MKDWKNKKPNPPKKAGPAAKRPSPAAKKHESEVDRLYKAVKRYVEQHNGSVVLAAGIEVQQWPEDRAGVFRLAVRCVGKKPLFPPEEVKP